MYGKRYKEPSYRSQNKKILLRIIITVLCAIAFSAVFCIVGIKLGKNVQSELPREEEQTTAPDENKDNTPSFEFKDLLPVKAVSLYIAENKLSPFDTVSVPLCGEDGKLLYLSSSSSLFYGSGFSTSLKPIAAAVNQAKTGQNRVCVSFKPFSIDANKPLANAYTLALIKELCSYNTDEILLEDSTLDASLIGEALGFVHSNNDKKLGVLLDASIFDGITSEKEKRIREFYSLYDFSVIDFTAFSLEEKNEITDAQTSAGNESTGSVETTSPSDAFSREKLYNILNENGLLIAKYSLRIRLYAPDEKTAFAAVALLEELEIENYEIVS